MSKPDALALADQIDAEAVSGRVSNHNGRQAAAELRRLHAENEALRVRLGHIAAVSHEGGLAGHDSIVSLVCVRGLSLPYWAKPSTLGGRLKQVQDAVSAAMKEQA